MTLVGQNILEEPVRNIEKVAQHYFLIDLRSIITISRYLLVLYYDMKKLNIVIELIKTILTQLPKYSWKTPRISNKTYSL